MANESVKQKSVGALWRKLQKDGKTTYFSGVWEAEDGTKTYFKAFRNQYKETEQQPDYRLILDQPLVSDETPVAAKPKATAATKPVAKTVVKKVVAKPAPEPEPEEEILEEEVLLD